jgi:hypothetical protein
VIWFVISKAIRCECGGDEQSKRRRGGAGLRGSNVSATLFLTLLITLDTPFIHPTLQVLFLQGRFIFGPDATSLFVTMFLIAAPVSIFCVFVARELMDNFSYGLGLPVMVAVVLFTAYVRTLLFLGCLCVLLLLSFCKS